MPLFAERVDEKTAQKVGETFLKSKMPGKTDLKLTQVAYANRADFSNFYVFGGENCFVIVSADDCVKPILGYSDENPFGTDAMPENVYGWLKDYDNQIQFAVENHVKASSDARSRWQNLKAGIVSQEKSTNSISPLLQTKWNQGSPFNALCPSGTVTGCVATAMAQVMKYWNYPSHGVGSHSYSWNGRTLSADFGNTSYDWDNMKGTYSSYTNDEKLAVATLMYHCGVSVDMNYGPISAGGSSASTSAVVDALVSYFNYKSTARYEERGNYSDETWIQMLIDELSAGRPVQYRGSDADGGGHSFVCEGYDTGDRFYFNWGWGGNYDGAFSIDAMNPGTGGIGSGSGVYTVNQGAIFGVEPNEDVPAPTNLTATLNDHDVTLNWTTAENVVSYNVYRDGIQIANVQTVNYVDENVFPGNHNYFVRSVNGNGALSLTSNTVSVIIEFDQPVVDDLAGQISNQGVELSWTEPDWVYPEMPSHVLSYVNQQSPNGGVGFKGATEMYWAHRYLAEDLETMQGMKVYKVSFYARYSGSYKLVIYKGEGQDGFPDARYPIFSQCFTISNTGMEEVILNDPVVIDENDLWIGFVDLDKNDYPAAYATNVSSNNYGNYYSQTGISTWNQYSESSWLIFTYVTDGTYSYNLYRDDVKIADALTETSYVDSQMANDAANIYTIKTNYYGGETEPSNKVGFAKGSVTVQDLSLSATDKVTVSKNASLTVNGNLVNQNAGGLILEDNAQLIHNNSGVQATVQKSITGYGSGNGNWYLVASPFVGNMAATPLTIGEYDLYSYDEPTHYWMNSKDSSSDFNTLTNGTGYLYANEADKQVNLSGELQPSNNHVDVSLSYTTSQDKLRGFNLVGNPFPCKATLMGDNIAADFYVMSDGRDELVMSQGIVVNPYEGIFVEATSSEGSVAKFYRWNPNYRGGESSASFDITVNEGRSEIDRARVRFGDGQGLDKFSMNDNSARIYITIDKQDYASVYVSGWNVLPLNFKPAHNGIYTLNFDLANADLACLHLIDNLTGADVDLMAAAASTSSASYSFDAKTTDYASRFKLVFAEKQQSDETDDSDFMYFADGQMFVFGAEENSIIQIVDATGRIVLNENVNGFVNKSLSLKPGIYVARMICGGAVKTQKFVAE